MAITHGFGGWTKIGSIFVLCRPGGSLTMPRQLDIPHPISYQSHGQLNYADGLRFPVTQLPMIPMDQASPWFTAALLNAWFMTRTSAPVWDLAEITGGLQFSDNGVNSGAGLGSWMVLKPKGAGFTVNVDKGQPVGFLGRFAGTDRSSTLASAPTGGLTGTPLEFDSVTLGGDLASKGIIGVSLQVDTGLTPNMALDGTARPVEHNAGLLTASLTIRMNAQSTVSPPGWNVDPAAYSEIAGTITIARTADEGDAVEFSFGRGILVNPDDRRQGQGRVIREFTYNLLGTTTTDPVVLSDV